MQSFTFIPFMNSRNVRIPSLLKHVKITKSNKGISCTNEKVLGKPTLHEVLYKATNMYVLLDVEHSLFIEQYNYQRIRTLMI
jgi:hypothetical protein